MDRVGQNHIYTVNIYGIFGRKVAIFGHIQCIPYIQFWPTLNINEKKIRDSKSLGSARTVYLYTVYDHKFGDIFARNTVYIHRIYRVLANPTHIAAIIIWYLVQTRQHVFWKLMSSV
jgi:hypothetical protein